MPEGDRPENSHILLPHSEHPYLCSKECEICGRVSPVNLIGRDWKGSEPHLHCALSRSIHWTVFPKASFALHV